MKKLITFNRSVKPKKLKTIKQNSASKQINADSCNIAEWFRRELAGNADMVFRELMIGGREDLNATLIYMYGNTDKNLLNDNVIKPLIEYRGAGENNSDKGTLAKRIARSCISIGKVKIVSNKGIAKDAVFQGNVLLIINNMDKILILEITEEKSRSITEPENEKTLRGSKEGFIENIWANIAMIRKTLPDTTLKTEIFKVGVRTKTSLAIIYVESLAEDRLVSEVRNRISKIDIDGVIADGYVEAFIEDNPYSPFPQVLGTEKPDKVVAALLEGRIAILLDRTPFVLLVPAQFIQFFQAPEDYYERFHMGVYISILRVIAFVVTTTAAPAYIALTSYHPELAPLDLILNIARLRKQVQFPPVVEALTMEFVIEALREAGLRLPTAVAATLGVVGGIILGDAAVKSNLVSPSMIIVVTITIICNFVIPNYSMTLVIRIIRLFLIILAATFGAFGITLGWTVIIIHLCRLESFSLPYFAPLAPTRFRDFRDLFVRVPIWAMKLRPDSIPVKDKKRLNNKREQK